MSFYSSSSSFLYFLFVWMMSRSILRWAVRSIFSCSFVIAHVLAPYVIVGVTTASNRCNSVSKQVGSGMSVPVDVWRTRGPCASDPVLHLGGFQVQECDHLPRILYFSFGRKYLDMHLLGLDFPRLVSLLACQAFGFCLGGFRVPALLCFC